ncbi:MAG: hypothetical protein U1E42_07770 [Rhodospirillales bacterium]
MTTSTSITAVREAVGVFRQWENLQAAVDDLMAGGFDRSELSLLADEKTVEKVLGHAYQRVDELEDHPDVPRAAFVGRDSLTEVKTFTVTGVGYFGAMIAVAGIVLSGGTLIATIAAAAAAGGGGALVGSWLARAIGRERAQSVQAQLGKGGLLLWVRVRDLEHERRAVDILKKNHADDVHLHDIAADASPERDPLANVQPDPFLPGART